MVIYQNKKILSHLRQQMPQNEHVHHAEGMIGDNHQRTRRRDRAAGIAVGVSEAVTMAVTAPSWAPMVSFTLLIALLLLRPGRV